MKNNLIFVYGTLRKGFYNDILLDESKFICNGILQGYSMYNLNRFPGIKKGNGIIFGELYKVNQSNMDSIDSLEGKDIMYDRIKEKISTEFGGICQADVYVYRHNVDEKDKIKSGEWR